MITLSGYTITERLYESNRSVVWRGIRDTDRLPIVFKLLRDEYPSPEKIGRFRREFEIVRNLNVNGVIHVYSLDKYGNSLIMLMEDFGGTSLDQIFASKPTEIDEVLELSVQLSGIISKIHQKQIIHKDINPSNVVWNPATGIVKLIDFGIATELPYEFQEIVNPKTIEGTLAYISPEQTGRMNCPIDYRSDLYTFGVTLFELLAGHKPFNTSDPLSIIHCHIAQTPPFLTDVNPKIPSILSHIIQKLLSKTPSDRYQSAQILKSDLEHCLNDLKQFGKIKEFNIAQHDISGKFQIPSKLYGRDAEIQMLISTFERVCKGSREVMLITGGPGIGKSFLVNEIHKSILDKQAQFISGKFEQYKRDIPYSSLIQSFGNLINRHLSESEDNLINLKEKILSELSTHAGIITEVIPELERLIGKQPKVTEASPQEAQNRFHFAFKKFVRIFADKTHPLVMFIDDLQWSDAPSLTLIQELLCDSDSGVIFFIGAYRDTEVNSAHPLMLTLKEIEKAGNTSHTLTLKPLHQIHVTQLISDMFLDTLEHAEELASLCLKKTQGNPFFLNQFLSYLYQNKLIFFNGIDRKWECEINKIQEAPFTDNVVSLMTMKLQTLPNETKQALKIASCMGHQFDLETLSMVSHQSSEQTIHDLWQALKDNLIIPIGGAYKFFYDGSLTHQVRYSFLHDRVHEASYGLLEPQEKIQYHYEIGTKLKEHTLSETSEDHLIEMVHQFNLGRNIISDEREKIELSRFNLMAGRKAKLSVAYQAAKDFFNIGIDLLPSNAWQTHYELMLQLTIENCEVSYLVGNHKDAGKYYETVLYHATSPIDKIQVYQIRIVEETILQQIPKAFQIGVEALSMLGIDVTTQLVSEAIKHEMEQLNRNMEGRTIESLMYLPDLTDPYQLAVAGIYDSMITPCYLGNPDYFPLIILKLLNLSLIHGNSPNAANAYSFWGIYVTNVLNDIDQGFSFANLSLKVIERYSGYGLKCKIYMLFGAMMNHWKNHLRENDFYNIQSYKSGIEGG
ncbi:MAG: serine/threonine-protein kinase PknK, partial [Desulfobacterales bacterium]|nr:serine/threonine-protein kinase PknK [Desulfobacterales bacterium]